MSGKSMRLIAAGMCLTSALLIPATAQARGAGSAVGAAMSRGAAMLGARGMMRPNFFSGFPFFGGFGGYGGYPEIVEPFAVPQAAPLPQQVSGPMQVQVLSPNAQPLATSTRTVDVNGQPSTVTSPLVTEYHWTSAQQHSFARTRMRKGG